jgi:hypothetical protein
MPSLFSSSTLPSVPSVPSVPNIPNIPSGPNVPGDLPSLPSDLPSLPSDLPSIPSATPSQPSINNPTSNYENKIQTIQQQLPAILDDFKKYYVFYSKNPTYNEYQSIFDNLQSNLKDIGNELIKISNSTTSDISDITNKLLEINKLIEKEKTRNDELKSEAYDYSNKYKGSKELIKNYKEIYNWNYLMNIFIFLGIVTAIILLLRFFTKKNNIVNVPPK